MEAAPDVIALAHPARPRASVIVVAAQHGPLLERCLERLANVPVGTVPFEVVVVLDGAGEAGAERLRQRVSGAVIEAPTVEVGLAGALNRGRARARGEFLVSLHDDAEVEPGWLDALVAVADADPQVGAVGSLIMTIDGYVQAAGMELLPAGTTRPAWKRSVLDLDRVHVVDQCGSASLLVRASTWDEIGGADERLYPVYYVDVDLCIAILARGQRIVLEPRSVIRHHQGASTDRTFARFVSRRNRDIVRGKWGDVISTHTPGSGVVMQPPQTEMPSQEHEPDPELQERAQLERALETTRAYAASLRARLARREAVRERARLLDRRLDLLTGGGWRRLRARPRLSRLVGRDPR